MKSNNSRILISATSSGAGKTLFTSALLQVLKFNNTHSFKCGPDYIDPMYHEVVLGIPSKNLDPYFMDEELMISSFMEDAGDINVIEGCMGLYDGLGVTSKCSTYEVSQKLKTPVILVVDAAKAGYSIVATIKGFIALDKNGLIKGVVLNRISEGYYKKLSKVIEDECHIKALGYIPVLKNATFESRHLGLKSVEENNAKEIILRVAALIKDTVDVESILKIAEQAKALKDSRPLSDYVNSSLTGEKPVIAVARDEVFNFLYKDNMTALEMCGANIEYFSPIHDKHLPKKAKGVVFPGGYPEIFAKELSDNKSMLNDVKTKIENGMPVLAECGGFMYLNKSIDFEDKTIDMVGIFDGVSKNAGRLVRFGYVNLKNDKYSIKGHEFHHFDVDNPGDYFNVTKAADGNVTYPSYFEYKNVIAGFPHLYYFSDVEFVKDFIDKAKDYE